MTTDELLEQTATGEGMPEAPDGPGNYRITIEFDVDEDSLEGAAARAETLCFDLDDSFCCNTAFIRHIERISA